MSPIRRCVFGCLTNGITLHNFPNPAKFPDHFKLWVELVGEPVENLTPGEIYRKKKVCDLHFTPEDRNRNNRLNAIATPVPFPYQKPPTTKRIRKRQSNLNAKQADLAQEDDIELDEEFPSIGDEIVEESVVPDNKTFSWQKQSEPLRIKAGDKTLHEGYHCDVCRCEIRGFRYACVQCSDFDLCSWCEARRAHTHHYVLRVPAPRPYTEIQFVLATIREHLIKNLDPKIESEQEHDDTLSIKSEIKSEGEDEVKKELPGDDWSDSSRTSPPYGEADSDNEDSVDSSEEEARSNRDLNYSHGVAATSSATVHTASKHHRPDLLNTAKKKILINLKDFMKAQDGSSSVKKICLMPVPSSKSTGKIPKALMHKIQFKPGSKIKLVKLPPGHILNTRQEKVSIKRWPPDKDGRDKLM